MFVTAGLYDSVLLTQTQQLRSCVALGDRPGYAQTVKAG